MKLYGACTLAGEIEWCRFKCTAAFFTVNHFPRMDFSRDFPAIRVSLREWIKGKPHHQPTGATMNQDVENQLGGASPYVKRGHDRRHIDVGIEERMTPPYVLERRTPPVERRRLVSQAELDVLNGGGHDH